MITKISIIFSAPIKFRRNLVAILVVLGLLLSCSSKPGLYQEQLLGFGTLIDVSVWGVDPNYGQTAVAEIAKDFEFMHKAWHAWHPGSLGRMNQLLPTKKWFTAAPSVIPLIEQAKVLSVQSGGRFNPAIGKLIKMWGFADENPAKGPPPESDMIDRLLAENPTMDDIEIKGVRIRSKNSNLKLDFGGFAKGVGVDIAIEHLRDLGITNAIVNAGGDIRVIGRHGERPWRVGIRNPRGPGMLASIEVEGDESIFTSGDYERYYEYQGIRYYHIIDPHTGYPARGTTSVTVFHHSAAEADAAATALFVAGPENWFEVAKSMGIKNVMLVDTRGTIYITPSLKNRIIFEVDPIPKIVISEPL